MKSGYVSSACIGAAILGSIMTAWIFYQNISTLPVTGAEGSLGFWLPLGAFSFVRKNERSRNPLCWFQAQLNNLSPHTWPPSFYRSSDFWPFWRISYHPLSSDPDIHELCFFISQHSLVHSCVGLLLNDALNLIVSSPHSRLGHLLDRGHITTVKLMT